MVEKKNQNNIQKQKMKWPNTNDSVTFADRISDLICVFFVLTFLLSLLIMKKEKHHVHKN